jgi:alpha-glucosidase (family GH31 glycosyl hydrolase)
MLLEIGSFLLSIERDPFRMTICRGGRVCLRTAPIRQAVVSVDRTDSAMLVQFSHHVLTITRHDDGLDLQVSPASADFSLSFELLGHWYGHGELVNQAYPLNRVMLPESVMQTFDNGPAGQSCKLTPAWYSSNGVLILAHTPVSVGINQPPDHFPRYEWSLGADKGPFAHRPFVDTKKEGDKFLTLHGEGLHLSLYTESGALAAYQHLVSLVGHPVKTPPAELFEKPTWTTWARYKTAVSQEVVLNFAEEIIRHQYPYNVMEIDDRWQVHYGDISFDPARFPDPKGMIEQLHAKGFKVTAWVIPFLDPESTAFAEGKAKGFMVRQRDGEPYLVPWWQGRGGLLDVTNPKALEWFKERLEKLQAETGLDGYKFDAGEAVFYPADAISAEPIHPNEFTHRYIDFIGKNFSLTEVRSGWMNQTAPIFFRQWDKWSTWGADNGLHSVLTGILSLGLTGYPFILPDMVGGNAYDQQADAELMIRWTQLNALLPAVQFSLAPWDYGDDCVEICRRYADLHLEFAPRIQELAAETARTGSPIIRPLWWLAERDERALTCDDEFLLGNDILVAPVVKPGALTRDIILPHGRWREHWNGEVFDGDTVLKDYSAPLDVLPLFERE